MADKRILAFDGTNLTASRWQKGQVLTDQVFTADDLGYESFSAYLASAKEALFYLLVDVSEEGFQLETIPAVQGGDRAALIKRRLGQFFFGTPFSLGHSLGREKEGRRDERMLFAALTRPEALTPWLELIAQAKRPLAGIYSVPLVLAENAKNMVSGHAQFLLVTLAAGGLRHTFFNEGQIQLLGQRLISRTEKLPTVVVAHTNDHAKLRTQFVDTDKLIFELLGLDTLATKLGLKARLIDSHCDALFAHQLISRTPKAQFAPDADRKLYRMSQIRAGLQTATVIVLVGCLAVAGRFGLQWIELRDTITSTNALAAADTNRHQALINELPKIKLTPDNLRAVISKYQEIVQRSEGPTPLLAHLSNALESMPTITLQKLDWAIADRSNSGTPTSAPSPSSVPAGNGATKVTTQLDVTAQLPITVAADQRQQIDLVENLISRLRTDGVEVTIIKSPVDIESGKALKRGSTDSDRPSGQPDFKIRLTSKQ
ncbi:MAG: hypothetical protein IPJ25_14055 [Rhodocyclaceae bacterium]|nr:hypothetical protein [Rhodocyclaceae bacterium]